MLPEIKVKIGADTGGLDKGIISATNSLGKFAKQAAIALGVAGAAGGFIAMTKAAIDNADALNKASQKMGIAVEALSRLQYAATLSDVSLEGLQTGMNGLARQMAAGNDAFKALGISVTNTDGTLRSSVSVLGDIADRFARMEDGTTKSALALEMFGRSGVELIPMLNAGSAGLAEMAKQSDAYNQTVSGETARAAERFNDTLRNIGFSIGGVFNKIMVEALPALQRFAEMLADPKFGQAAATLAKNVIDALSVILQVIAKITNALDAAFGGPSKLSNSKLKQDLKEYQAMLTSGEWLWDRDAVVKKVDELKAEIQRRLVQDPIQKGATWLDMQSFTGNTTSNSTTPFVPGAFGTAATGVDAERQRIADRLAVIQEGFRTESQLIQDQYKADQAALDEAHRLGLLSEEKYKTDLEDLEKQHQERLAAIKSAALQRDMTATASIFGSIVKIMEATGDKQIALQKAIASAGVVISTAAGIMKAIEQYGWPAGLLPAAAVAAEGMAQLATINSASRTSAGTASVSGSAGASTPDSASTMNRTVTVQGITPGQIFSGDAMRDFMEQLLQMQRDGYQVVLA